MAKDIIDLVKEGLTEALDGDHYQHSRSGVATAARRIAEALDEIPEFDAEDFFLSLGLDRKGFLR